MYLYVTTLYMYIGLYVYLYVGVYTHMQRLPMYAHEEVNTDIFSYLGYVYTYIQKYIQICRLVYIII